MRSASGGRAVEFVGRIERDEIDVDERFGERLADARGQMMRLGGRIVHPFDERPFQGKPAVGLADIFVAGAEQFRQG